MTNHDRLEWDALEALWLDQPVASPVPEALQARVRQQSLRMAAFAALEYLVGFALCAWMIWQATQVRGIETFLAAFATFAFVGWAMDFQVRNRQGMWHASGATTEAWLALALERCRRERRMLRFAWLLFAVELVVLSALLGVHWWLRHPGGAGVAGEVAFATALFVGFALVMRVFEGWYRGRIDREEAELRAAA